MLFPRAHTHPVTPVPGRLLLSSSATGHAQGEQTATPGLMLVFIVLYRDSNFTVTVTKPNHFSFYNTELIAKFESKQMKKF